jgi:hypothetical protein
VTWRPSTSPCLLKVQPPLNSTKLETQLEDTGVWGTLQIQIIVAVLLFTYLCPLLLCKLLQGRSDVLFTGPTRSHHITDVEWESNAFVIFIVGSRLVSCKPLYTPLLSSHHNASPKLSYLFFCAHLPSNMMLLAPLWIFRFLVS